MYFFLSGASLKVANSSSCKRLAFCRSIYWMKVTKLDAFIFKHSSYSKREYPTVNQFAYLYHLCTRAPDAGKEVQTVFFDITKALDRVWHEGLIYKLKAAGVSGDVLRLFQSYLSGHRQSVVLPGSFSKWVYIKAGVQRVLYLALFFLLYINDIVKILDKYWIQYPFIC